MRIKQIVIRNFKNVGVNRNCELVIPGIDEGGSSDFLTIIGENNIGKSSILEALRLFLPETGYLSTPTLDLFPFKKEPSNEREYMEIKLIFNELTELDQQHPYIRPYIYNQELIIKRTWKNSEQKDKDVPFEVFIPTRNITELIEVPTWNRNAFINTSDRLQELHSDFCEENNISNGTITSKKKEEFVEFVFLNEPSLIIEGEPEWLPNPNGFSSKIRSIMPRVIYVPAVKLISDEADANKNKSAANQIASALFEHHLSSSEEIETFKTALDSLKSIFQEETKHVEVLRIQRKLSEKLKRLMEVEANIDFDIPEVMEKLHLNSSILLKHNNLLTKPSEQGSGVQRMLILSLLELMSEQLKEYEEEVWKRSFLFLIEEPEIYLHPHLQRKMRDSLVQISKHPTAQIICTSHSENFIDLADRHQGIALLKKGNDGKTEIVQVPYDIYDGDTNSEKRQRMRMLLNFNTTTLEAFFAERVILVEGDCEVASFIAIKQKLKELYHDKSEKIEKVTKNISIIPCNGKLTQIAYYEVLKFFGVQPYLVHDLDGIGEDEGTNQNILARIGVEEHRLIHQQNFEDHIFGETWERDKPWKATNRIYNNFNEYKEGLIRYFKFVIGEQNFDELQLAETERENVN